MRATTTASTALLALLLLTGCGGESDASGSDGAAAALDPATELPCAEVWVEGETLPDDYVTCDDGTDEYNTNDGYWTCADGTEVWFNHESYTFASQGEIIRKDEGDALHDALEECGVFDD